MLTIGVVDDNIGGLYLASKLRAALPCNYICLLCAKPFGGAKRKMFERAEECVDKLQSAGCDAVVLAPVALGFVGRALSQRGRNVYYCETPILHAATYTVSNILVVSCDEQRDKLPVDNVISVYMPRFTELAEAGNEQNMVDYIAECAEGHSGQFDCIALGHSSMNGYKRCFKRVFPNAQVFDSVDGVVRRMRKKYRKHCKDDGELTVVDDDWNDVTDKYALLLR